MAQQTVQHHHSLEIEVIDPHSADGGRMSPETLLLALNAAQKAVVEALNGTAEIGDMRVSTYRETTFGLEHESDLEGGA
jgi:hypothetical protein